MRSLCVLMEIVSALLLIVPRLTSSDDRNPDRGAVTVTSDADFLTKASRAGQAEVEIAKLAAEHASTKAVRTFAVELLQVHTRINDRLELLAQKERLAFAKGMDDFHRRTLKQLKQLQGAEFDRTFLVGQVKDHDAVVLLFRLEAENGKDTELKSLAAKSLPRLKQHLAMAKDLLEVIQDRSKQSNK